MGFFADLKTKREAKKAQRIYQLELAEWDRENKVLSEALEIFEGAAKGDEPDDTSLVQKKGELVLWVGNGIYHEAGRTPSRYVGGSTGPRRIFADSQSQDSISCWVAWLI